MILQKCIRILSIRSFVHEQALVDKYHENSIQGAYEGGNQGYEVERGWSMVHMGHGWVHNMKVSHQEHEFSIIVMEDTCGPHLLSAWASLVPKIVKGSKF